MSMPVTSADYGVAPPRWAFERVEQEKCAALGLVPNPLNIDVWLRDRHGWPVYWAWAAYVARVEPPPPSDPDSATCTCQRYPTHCANDCPLHGLDDPPCRYCQNGQLTGLPGNACENCMGTGVEH